MLKEVNLLQRSLYYREILEFYESDMSELKAFVLYARAYPSKFLALIDTFSTLKSGLLNFICVALTLIELDYQPVGVRLDSGDLVQLSIEIREKFEEIGKKFEKVPQFSKLKIVASNDINEEFLRKIQNYNHEIDIFGIGTHLVTCQS